MRRVSRRSPGSGAICACVGFVLAVVAAMPAAGQMADVAHDYAHQPFDSGEVVNHRRERGVIWSTVVRVKSAAWMRLYFDDAELGRAATRRGGKIAQRTQLRITSLVDGAVQTLDFNSMRQWGNSSAYFNGDALLLEIIADPKAGPSRISGSDILFGLPGPQPALRTLCGSDDRVPSTDARMGRTSNGCTAWMIDDAERCMLTAGHCDGSVGSLPFDVVHFNVPESEPDGTLNMSVPDDQYAIDPASIQSTGSGVPGTEYTYFGVFPNSNTGLTPAEAQGAFFTFVAPPAASSQTLRVTGYGTTNPPDELNQVQQTSTGPFVANPTSIEHQVDTTPGNSGSPIILESTGEAIGIHTHGGCDVDVNEGTKGNHAPLAGALANPLGACNTFFPPPANDDCVDALVVSNGLFEFDTRGASTDGSLHIACNMNGFADVGPDIWYLYTATCTDDLIISTCGAADFDTRIAVYDTIECTPGFSDAPIVCADNSGGCAGDTTEVVLAVTEGEQFLIRVGGNNSGSGDTGTGTLTIQCGEPCVGDANGDSSVNLSDLLDVLSNWGTDGSGGGDANGDGAVNLTDLLDVLSNWGNAC